MKKNSFKILTILTISVFILQFGSVFAVSQTSLKNEKKDNNEQISNAQSDLKDVQAQKSEAVTEVENLDKKISSYETEIGDLEGKISTLNGQITESEQKIGQAEQEYKEKNALLDERLVLMYENGNTSYIDFLLSSKGLTDFISNYYLVSELASYDADLLEQIQTKKKEIEAEKQKLESSKQELATSKVQKEQAQSGLEVAKGEKSKQVTQLTQEEKDIQEKIDQLKEDNKAIDAKIAAAQAAIEAAKKEHEKNEPSNGGSGSNSSNSGNSNSGGSNSGSVSSSGFIRPVAGYPITTTWYYSSGALHGAVDFSGSGISGKPIQAVADGIVITAEALKTSYGNYVIIAHYNGLYTLYAHGQAGSIAVSEGQKVSQGQQIMKVGSTGNSTGPHLHFEVRQSPGKYANRVNPLNYLP